MRRMTTPTCWILIVGLFGSAACSARSTNQSAQPLDNGQAGKIVGLQDTDGNGLLEIHNLNDLSNIRQHLTGPGKATGFELMQDLDFNNHDDYADPASMRTFLGGKGFKPIGAPWGTFDATFDGRGHTIRTLTIKRSSQIYVGLFSQLGENATVTGVTLAAASIVGGPMETAFLPASTMER